MEPKTLRTLAAVVTPFDERQNVDHPALAAHCGDLLRQGCDGLVLFGTSGEAASLTRDERMDALNAVLAHGVPPERLIVGTGSCVLSEAIALTRQAVDARCAGVLVLPPFYYKEASEDGLFAWYAALIDACAGAALRLHLYHFPSVSQVPISPALARRLRDRFPENVIGYKDSSGDIEHMRRILAAVPELEVRVGSESLLLETLKTGGAGCISATLNLHSFAAEAAALASDPWSDAMAARQEALARRRALLRRLPSITAVKHLLSRRHGKPAWANVRLPLVPLTSTEAAMLDADFQSDDQ